MFNGENNNKPLFYWKLKYHDLLFMVKPKHNVSHRFLSLGPPTRAPSRLYIMPCICYNDRTFTNMTQDDIIVYLVRETQIQRNSTVRNVYKLKSRPDSRQSSSYIGLIVTGVIGALTFLIIVSDMPRIYRHLKAVLNGKSLAEPLKKKKWLLDTLCTLMEISGIVPLYWINIISIQWK